MAKVNKTLTINVEHQEFLEDQNMSPSKLLREKIDEKIKQQGWVRRNGIR